MEYSVHPGKSDLFVGIAATLFSSVFFCVPFYLFFSFVLYLVGVDLIKYTGWLFLGTFLATFTFLWKVQLKHFRKFSFWKLTDSCLTGGKSGEIKILLEDIESIHVGLPRGLHFKPKYRLAKKRTLDHMAASVFVLRTNCGGLLVWRIYELPKGRELMTAFYKRMKYKVKEQVDYTDKELACMTLKNLNRFIKG